MAGLINVRAFNDFLRKSLMDVAREVDKYERRLLSHELAEICQDIEPSQFC